MKGERQQECRNNARNANRGQLNTDEIRLKKKNSDSKVRENIVIHLVVYNTLTENLRFTQFVRVILCGKFSTSKKQVRLCRYIVKEKM